MSERQWALPRGYGLSIAAEQRRGSLRVLSIFGTRPEAIKMAPVVLELARHPHRIESIVCVTAQHREMLDQVLACFSIEPDLDLDLMEEGQSPAAFMARALPVIARVVSDTAPDVVLVQGDTTTAMTASLAAYYGGVALGHVEAGLRTGWLYSPFPEEMNRRFIDIVAAYHFAPTRGAAEALCREGIDPKTIFVTGNTVVDALRQIRERPPRLPTRELLSSLGLSAFSANDMRGDGHLIGDRTRRRDRYILVTLHRRESFGEPLRQVCSAIAQVAARDPAVNVVFPVHPNPSVRDVVQQELGGRERVHLIEPLAYETFVQLMSRVDLIITDSGGIQEEAPSLGTPVLVVREHTERPEAIQVGSGTLVGLSAAQVAREAVDVLRNLSREHRTLSVNPFGDGQAAQRIVSTLLDSRIEVRRQT